jgi:hypothetical protein
VLSQVWGQRRESASGSPLDTFLKQRMVAHRGESKRFHTMADAGQNAAAVMYSPAFERKINELIP